MDGRNSDTERFASWVEELMRRRGYDIDSPRGGGRSRLAEDAGVHRAAVTRLLQRQSLPDLETMRALARVLGVGLRDMLIQSGRATAEDLPLPDAARPAGGGRRVTPEEAGELLGIPESHRRQFVEMTEMIMTVSGARPVGGGRHGGRRDASAR
ncbi:MULTISPECIES: helix-turn-helix domain-containing protein [Streptomyces]|uniref:helix-turn-helix domain-containing protein n=1 Tax=Streptomyces TaxID=1883 RepID=UPI00163BCA4E|nr:MULTISPECIES: helix-turn-helix transcriptional regulator [Streptomyces]MBC2877452.1 helix-turn-helix transcriptional regulator [Streptomyces sp. TYQ1024]UBI38250.1 helix-turn-helix transcriptional regulator [Streptomyces mobaraensis]UKW30836.1 helix-turn-helix transcriptional regulator [Streptomyces sp. TYQ1024]